MCTLGASWSAPSHFDFEEFEYVPRHGNSLTNDSEVMSLDSHSFFAHGELTVTLEDIENHWRLPILGDCDPSKIELSPTKLKAENILLNYVGKKNIFLGASAARLTTWPLRFFEEDMISVVLPSLRTG